MKLIEPSTGPVELRILPGNARFSLLVDPSSRSVISRAFGIEIPIKIGRHIAGENRSALCLGPDEWVLYGELVDAPAISQAFAEIYVHAPHSLTDISDREMAIQISGLQAQELLSTSCSRDISAIPAGRGTRTLFDTVPVILLKTSETEFRMECWRSYLPHIWALLNTANRELAAGL